jgi:hypothetical protein
MGVHTVADVHCYVATLHDLVMQQKSRPAAVPESLSISLGQDPREEAAAGATPPNELRKAR